MGIFDDEPARQTIEDAYKYVLKNRKVWLAGEVDPTSAFQINTELHALDMSEPGEPIELYINSVGGCVYSCHSIIDMMNNIESPVHTVVFGEASSAAAFILAAGEPGSRYASPNSYIMIHGVSSGSFGKTDDMEVNVDQMKTLEVMIFKNLAKQCGVTVKKITKDTRKDYFLSAQEAKDYGRLGLVDHILK